VQFVSHTFWRFDTEIYLVYMQSGVLRRGCHTHRFNTLMTGILNL